MNSTQMNDLIELLNHPEETLLWRYRIGEAVCQLLPDDREDTYGARQMTAIVNAITESGCTTRADARSLYSMQAFALCFSESEIEQFRDASWTHVRVVLGIADDEARLNLLKRAIAERWPTRRLAAEAGLCRKQHGGYMDRRRADAMDEIRMIHKIADRSLAELRRRSDNLSDLAPTLVPAEAEEVAREIERVRRVLKEYQREVDDVVGRLAAWR